MRRERIGEGAKVMAMVGVPGNLVDARHEEHHWVGAAEPGGRCRGLALFGQPGRGKSWLAAGLVRRRLWELARKASPDVREWWLADGGVRFVRVDALLQHARHDAFTSAGAGDEADVVRAWGELRWLVLDDLGAEKRSEWGAQTLHSLLSHREADQRSVTLVTTNYDVEDLEEMYAGWGGPIASRLRGLCEWVRVEGKDRRA